MEDLPGFPPALMQRFNKDHCIAVLLEVMKEHAESPWFHINDIPKPIRRVFYARMKTASCSVNEEPATETIKTAKDEVKSNASFKTDITSVKSNESVKKGDTRSRKNVRVRKRQKTDKPKNSGEILASIEAHCFPDGDKTFKEVKDLPKKQYRSVSRELEYQSLIANGHVDHHAVQREMENIAATETDRKKFQGTSAAWKLNKTLGGYIRGDVSYGRIPINRLRCSNDQHKAFWESLFGFSYGEIAIPRSQVLREQCLKIATENFGNGPIEGIYRKEIRCKKIFIDLRIVRMGAYQANEYPKLFKG